MTRVKICGITHPEDLVAAAEAGADFVGFVFYEKSPRAVTPEQVRAMTALIPALDVPRVPQCVGVFVDPAPEQVEGVVQRCGLAAAQVHRAAPEKLGAIRERLHGALYPAIQPQHFAEALAAFSAFSSGGESLSGPAPWLPQLLVDAYHPVLVGGTGQRADLTLARRLAATIDRIMLAGGLAPDNVAETVRAVQPWAVDVSGGVEAAPGKKDHGKIRAFIQAVRAVDEEMAK